jgi:hypothetical protein
MRLLSEKHTHWRRSTAHFTSSRCDPYPAERSHLPRGGRLRSPELAASRAVEKGASFRRESAHYVALLPRSEGAIVGSDTGRPLIDGETLRPVTGHDGSLVLEHARVFDAPTEQGFRLFTDPTELAKWWGPLGFTTPEVRIACAWAAVSASPCNRPRAKHSLSPGSSLRSSHPPRSGSRFVETSRFPMTARRSRRCHWSLSAEDERDADPGRLCYGGQARATPQRLGRELREARRGPQDSRRVGPGATAVVLHPDT